MSKITLKINAKVKKGDTCYYTGAFIGFSPKDIIIGKCVGYVVSDYDINKGVEYVLRLDKSSNLTYARKECIMTKSEYKEYMKLIGRKWIPKSFGF